MGKKSAAVNPALVDLNSEDDPSNNVEFDNDVTRNNVENDMHQEFAERNAAPARILTAAQKDILQSGAKAVYRARTQDWATEKDFVNADMVFSFASGRQSLTEWLDSLQNGFFEDETRTAVIAAVRAVMKAVMWSQGNRIINLEQRLLPLFRLEDHGRKNVERYDHQQDESEREMHDDSDYESPMAFQMRRLEKAIEQSRENLEAIHDYLDVFLKTIGSAYYAGLPLRDELGDLTRLGQIMEGLPYMTVQLIGEIEDEFMPIYDLDTALHEHRAKNERKKTVQNSRESRKIDVRHLFG